jgi:outer membrane protein OmpA-like peptidoglycan-associated protein
VKDVVKVNLHGVFAPSGTTILFDAFPSLDALAGVLAGYSNLPVTIEGYGTEQKSEEENIKLGETQAETVKNYLVSKGISPQRFKVMSVGLGVKEGVKEDSRIEVIIHLFELSNT